MVWSTSRRTVVYLLVVTFIGFSSQECPPADTDYTEDPATGKLYKLYQTPMNYDEAEKICNEVGARLAMAKTEEDFDTITSYRDQVSEDMWIGADNRDLVECWKEECDGVLYWIDGTRLTMQPWFKGLDGNDPSFCVRMTDSYHMGDKACVPRPFLCQMDCQNLHFLSCSPPDAPGHGQSHSWSSGEEPATYETQVT